jgi:ABC-2 type transport system permease protein
MMVSDMKRFWILLKTEFKAWLANPLPALGGFLPPTVLLIAFGFLFSSDLAFPIAVINNDNGPMGNELMASFEEVISPFDQPYYKVLPLSEDEAWQAYQQQRIDGIWVIPEDFSARLDMGDNPQIETYFSNYNDDRAKNHRIYETEILWHFYEKIGQPAPPLEMREEYPLPVMVDWFAIIAVGLVMLGITLGAMFNIFMLTYEEQKAKITVENGMSPRPITEILFPKVVLALFMGLFTGTLLLLTLFFWKGIWPGQFIWHVYLACGMVSIFWIAIALVMGLRARHFMAGAIASILTGVTVFFIGGGLSPVRFYPDSLLFIARLFPNTHVMDPLRDLILFHTMPNNWNSLLGILVIFVVISTVFSLVFTNRQLRKIG